MMCERPYMKDPVGIKRLDTLVSNEARTAATPFPCGRCPGCLINKSREWKTRLLLESMTSSDSLFITLTYNDEAIPSDWNLEPKDFTDFIKRIRRAIEPQRLRYFGVGEYGDRTERPHYHAILFGMSIIDLDLIEMKWNMGFVHAGEVNEKTADYVTGYILKDQRSVGNPMLKGKVPEFARMSKGLGLEFIKQVAVQTLNNPYHTKRIIREIRIGSKLYPLGRYLTKKLAEMLGVTESRWKADVYVYQEGLFEKYMKGGTYYDNLVKSDEGKRKSKIKRNRIYKSKRKI